MDIIIRPARIDDAGAIAEMLMQLADGIGDGHTFMSDADTIRRYGFGKKPLFQCLIAEYGGGHQGLALFFPAFSTTRGKPGVYVQDLWIAESARRQGLGARLLARVANCAASEWQATYLKLTVYADNPAATKFYRRLGFQSDERDLPMALNGTAFQALRGQL